jgi:hypothetical protein
LPRPLDQSVQNAYSDLLSSSLSPAFDGKGLSFTRKVIKSRTYLYVSAKVGNLPIQRYLGPDNQETRTLIEKEKALWISREASRATRARLVNMLLAGGLDGPTPQEGKILRMLERGGLFLAGGVLIGTPAFRTLGAMLGFAWEKQFATRDVDIAVDYQLPVAIKPLEIDLKAILEASGMGFIEVPMLNAKHPSTRYKMRGGEFSVELLTPDRGKPSHEPINIPAFNAVAEPMRYLDYLIEGVQPAVVPFDIGVLVNVPDPARFAVHKLAISQRRPTAFAAKSAKDIDQARQILEVLIDVRPGSLLAAFDAAEQLGRKFIRYYQSAISLLPVTLQKSLNDLLQ